MNGSQTQLRDRMLRDAIVEVLRGTFDACGDGEVVSLEVGRRVQALPEVTLTEITVVPSQPSTEKTK